MSKISDQGPHRPGSGPGLQEDVQTGRVKSGDKRDVEKEADEFSRLIDSGKKGKGKAEEDADAFASLMKGLGDRETRSRSPSEAILQSLQTRSCSDSPAMADGVPSSPSISKVAQEIADRILVSDISRGGGEEVRISLKDSVMPGTEIRIVKEGESIRVEILTTSNESHRLLSDHRGALQEALKERVSDSVSVEVKFHESEEEHRDGRSRQQRNLYEEMEE
jgi:type III secretion system needle length determinant